MNLLLFAAFILAVKTAVIPNNLFDYIEPTEDKALLKEDKNFWFQIGENHLNRKLQQENEIKRHVAKNVVILIGDGMGIQTITATRIYKGQRMYSKSGEDHSLVYDEFPNVALAKTYNVDMQVPDSAATATAIFTGVKARFEAVGLDVLTNVNVANEEMFERSKVDGIMKWAQDAGKDTGIITTTRLTHATPACTYAHSHHRSWECDSKIPDQFKPFVKDIARQLIEDAPGRNYKVILGGGSQQFGYNLGNLSSSCVRSDGLNLVQTWINNHKEEKAAFVTNNFQLANITNVDYLFGLFHQNHLPYELIRNETPSLSEMTSKGLEILKRSTNGFVLMVEGGRIDLAHHENQARLALEESAEFEKTVSLVVDETDDDTLIIVTADHSHSMTINGYSKRGNDILGYGLNSEDTKPALTLTYANGPGFTYHYSPNLSSVLNPWIDVRTDKNLLNNPWYQHMGSYELEIETHGGEDVGIFAKGPGSYLMKGVVEQNYIAHVISYAACIGPRSKMNSHCFKKNSAPKIDNKSVLIIGILILKFRYFTHCY